MVACVAGVKWGGRGEEKKREELVRGVPLPFTPPPPFPFFPFHFPPRLRLRRLGYGGMRFRAILAFGAHFALYSHTSSYNSCGSLIMIKKKRLGTSLRLLTIGSCFGVRISSYGCTREVWGTREKRTPRSTLVS